MTVEARTLTVPVLAGECGQAPQKEGQQKGGPPVVTDAFHVLVIDE